MRLMWIHSGRMLCVSCFAWYCSIDDLVEGAINVPNAGAIDTISIIVCVCAFACVDGS